MPNGISHDATKMEQELYRAGTRINVTLKYTRTGAVIQSLIEQLCITFKFGIDELIMHAKEPLYLPYDEKMKLLKEKYPGIFDAYFALYAELAQLGA